MVYLVDIKGPDPLLILLSPRSWAGPLMVNSSFFYLLKERTKAGRHSLFLLNYVKDKQIIRLSTPGRKDNTSFLRKGDDGG